MMQNCLPMLKNLRDSAQKQLENGNKSQAATTNSKEIHLFELD
jgi:hypothetical protein